MVFQLLAGCARGKPAVPTLELGSRQRSRGIPRILLVRPPGGAPCFSPFRNARRLRTLRARGAPIRDLSLLEDLENLKELDLSNTEVTDLSPLVGLAQLEELDLSETQIRDLSPLKNLTNLRELVVSKTRVEDLSPVLSLPRLEELDISDAPHASTAERGARPLSPNRRQRPAG